MYGIIVLKVNIESKMKQERRVDMMNGKVRQYRTEQNSTEQNRTVQNRTEQSRTEQFRTVRLNHLL
jgi:hypothetical protein